MNESSMPNCTFENTVWVRSTYLAPPRGRESLITSISANVNERVRARRLIRVNFVCEFECKSAVSPTLLCHIQLRTIFVRESALVYHHQRQ